ncbi:MAG: sugar phosphate isomerase/epimerase family protein [Planctomycetota bacterium]|jgi:sugar phosphate isomerase/epimerase
MLLTLATRSLSRYVTGNGDQALSMFDLPDFAIRQLQLHGLNLPASMLAGWSLQDLDTLRDRADKAACPCLVLIEDSPLPFAHARPGRREEAADRVRRLAVAANRLGCNAVAVHCEGKDDDATFDRTAAEIKQVMPAVERFELNLLIAPHDGLTAAPDRLTELIKRIGGFRIGSLPDFGHAAASGNAVEALRKLAPYAGAVHATVKSFAPNGRHQDYELADCVSAIRSVGFVNTLAIDYTGTDDPVEIIEKAREVLQSAIESGS